jgi:hypothetical protein
MKMGRYKMGGYEIQQWIDMKMGYEKRWVMKQVCPRGRCSSCSIKGRGKEGGGLCYVEERERRVGV